jgi:hypothetical protein
VYTGEYHFKDEFSDAGFEIDQQCNENFHIGLRLNYIWDNIDLVSVLPINPFTGQVAPLPYFDDTRETMCLNPYVALEGQWFGAGLGVVSSTHPLGTNDTAVPPDDEPEVNPSGHLRIGDERFHALYQHWESIPIYSGGGEDVVGLGLGAIPRLYLFLGLATNDPYGQEAVIGRLGIDVTERLRLEAGYRLPEAHTYSDSLGTYSFDEWSGSVGLTYRIPWGD